MAKKILIVGGGLSGTIVANGLCRQLREELSAGSVTITMLGATDKHMYQPGLLYVPFGKMRESELFRDQRKVLDRRVPYFVDPAKHIDVDKKSVTTQSGKTHTYDFLVIATGSRIRPDNIPGMTEGGNWFYDLDGARKMRDALNAFKGGKIVVNVNAPHKCPVAPLEITFMLRDFLAGKGLLDKSEITYTYPIGRLHALEPVAHWTVPEFEQAGIKSETFFNTKSVDAEGQDHHLGRRHHPALRSAGHHPAAQRPAGDHRFRTSAPAAGCRRCKTRCCGRLGQRLHRRRHHQHPDLEGRLHRPFRGRHHHRQPVVADQRRPLGARLRRQGVLLRRDRHEHRAPMSGSTTRRRPIRARRRR